MFASPARPWTDRACVPERQYPSENPEDFGAPEEIRTPDPQIRSLVLYPAELRARLAHRAGKRSQNEQSRWERASSYRLRPTLARFGARGAGLDSGSVRPSPAGRSASKTRVNALTPRGSIVLRKTFCEEDGLPGHKRVHARLPTRYARQ